MVVVATEVQLDHNIAMVTEVLTYVDLRTSSNKSTTYRASFVLPRSATAEETVFFFPSENTSSCPVDRGRDLSV